MDVGGHILVTEWARGKTDSTDAAFFPTDFWLLINFFVSFSFSLFIFLRSEHPQVRPCPNTVHRQHCQREQTWFKAVSLLTWTNQPGWRNAKGDNIDGGGASSVDGIALDKQICLGLHQTSQKMEKESTKNNGISTEKYIRGKRKSCVAKM